MLRFHLPKPQTKGPSGILKPNSPVTVAGTAPDIRRLPYYPRSRADLMRGCALGGIGSLGKGLFILPIDLRWGGGGIADGGAERSELAC